MPSETISYNSPKRKKVPILPVHLWSKVTLIWSSRTVPSLQKSRTLQRRPNLAWKKLLRSRCLYSSIIKTRKKIRETSRCISRKVAHIPQFKKHQNKISSNESKRRPYESNRPIDHEERQTKPKGLEVLKKSRMQASLILGAYNNLMNKSKIGKLSLKITTRTKVVTLKNWSNQKLRRQKPI